LKITKPLIYLLVKIVPFEFNEEYLSSFHWSKKALIYAPIMQTSEWELPFEIMPDATYYAVVLVLGQKNDNKPRAIYYMS